MRVMAVRGGLSLTIRYSAFAAIVVAASGCAGMIREGRMAENTGVEVRGRLDAVILAIEGTLRNDGYDVVEKPNAKGPDMSGREISCFRLRGVTQEQYRVMKLQGRFRNNIKYHGAIKAEMDEMAVRLDGIDYYHDTYEKWRRYRALHDINDNSVSGTSDRLVIDVSRKWDEASDYTRGVPDTVILKLDLMSCRLHVVKLLEDCEQNVNGGEKINEILTGIVSYLRSQPNAHEAGAPQEAGAAAPVSATSVDESYKKAGELYAAGDYTGAWSKASEVVRAKPDHWEGWQLLGNCQYAQGDKTAAISSYEYSLSVHPDNPQLKAWVEKLKSP